MGKEEYKNYKLRWVGRSMGIIIPSDELREKGYIPTKEEVEKIWNYEKVGKTKEHTTSNIKIKDIIIKAEIKEKEKEKEKEEK